MATGEVPGLTEFVCAEQDLQKVASSRLVSPHFEQNMLAIPPAKNNTL
jgi:hypothetical protein